jgi:hypothetical protein
VLQQEIAKLLREFHRPSSPTDDVVLTLSVEEWMRLRGHVLCMARAPMEELDCPGEVRAAAVALDGLNANELFSLVEQSGFLAVVAGAAKDSALAEHLSRELRKAPGPLVKRLWRSVWAGEHRLRVFQNLDWPLKIHQIRELLTELSKKSEALALEDNGSTPRAWTRLLRVLPTFFHDADCPDVEGLASGFVEAVAAGAAHRFPLMERTIRRGTPRSESLALAVLSYLGKGYFKTQRPFARERLSMAALALAVDQIDPSGGAWLQEWQRKDLTDTNKSALLWVGGISAWTHESGGVAARIDDFLEEVEKSRRVQLSLVEGLAGMVDVMARFSTVEGDPLERRWRTLRRIVERPDLGEELGNELFLFSPHLYSRVSERVWNAHKDRMARALRANSVSAALATLGRPDSVPREESEMAWSVLTKMRQGAELLPRLWETAAGIGRLKERLWIPSRGGQPLLQACFSSCYPSAGTMDEACALVAYLLERCLQLAAPTLQSLLDTTLLRIPPGRLEMNPSLRGLVEEFLSEAPAAFGEGQPHRSLSTFYHRQWAAEEF